MKNQLAQTALFLDRPLTTTTRPSSRVSALFLTGFDRTDYTDSILRVFLALSLLGSLVMCGREWSAPATPVTRAIVQHVSAPNALACSTPRSCRDVL